MYLKVVYGSHTEKNRGKVEVVDQALRAVLGALGFEETGSGFDLRTGERDLAFKAEKAVKDPREGDLTF